MAERDVQTEGLQVSGLYGLQNLPINSDLPGVTGEEGDWERGLIAIEGGMKIWCGESTLREAQEGTGN
jgi:hypothetical protein